MMSVIAVAAAATVGVVVVDQERLPRQALALALDAHGGVTCVGQGRAIDAVENVDRDAVDVVLVAAHHPGIDLLAALASADSIFPGRPDRGLGRLRR